MYIIREIVFFFVVVSNFFEIKMANYTKSSYSKFLKNLKTSYPVKVSKRNPIAFDDSRLAHKEFKQVLPFVLKDSISGKGTSTRPGKI